MVEVVARADQYRGPGERARDAGVDNSVVAHIGLRLCIDHVHARGHGHAHLSRTEAEGEGAHFVLVSRRDRDAMEAGLRVGRCRAAAFQ